VWFSAFFNRPEEEHRAPLPIKKNGLTPTSSAAIANQLELFLQVQVPADPQDANAAATTSHL
jgi:hypothetical protein